jgi:hypothetical protein
MKLITLALILLCASFAQIPQPHGEPPIWIDDPKEPDGRLPDGKSQKEEILKADYKKNLEEAAELAKLAADLKADLEKNTRYVVSLQTLKKTDEIEKLAKSIRGRLKKY